MAFPYYTYLGACVVSHCQRVRNKGNLLLIAVTNKIALDNVFKADFTTTSKSLTYKDVQKPLSSANADELQL